MSNRDFDDDFNFDDEFDADSSDDLGDDLSPDFGDDVGEDLPDLEDEPDVSDTGGTGGGPSRAFLAIAGVMVLLFLLGLGAVIFFAIRPPETTPLEFTATAIVMTNAFVLEMATQTGIAITDQAGTAIAQAQFTDTPTPRPTVTPTFTPTATNTLDPTLLAAQNLTQTALALNPPSIGDILNEILRTLDSMTPEQQQQAADQLEGIADQVRPTDPVSADSLDEAANALRNGDIATARQAIQDAITSLASAATTQTALALSSAFPPTSDIQSVAQTATALAIALGGATPTIDLGIGGGGDVPTQEGVVTTGGQLPQTGFFDEVIGGGRNGVGIIIMMGFGLVGVIFISRRLRATANSK